MYLEEIAGSGEECSTNLVSTNFANAAGKISWLTFKEALGICCLRVSHETNNNCLLGRRAHLEASFGREILPCALERVHFHGPSNPLSRRNGTFGFWRTYPNQLHVSHVYPQKNTRVPMTDVHQATSSRVCLVQKKNGPVEGA